MEKLNKDLIAPCGMNCGLCRAHLKAANTCAGCRKIGKDCPVSRLKCPIRTCTERKGEFCYECAKFPCDKLKHLDKRYRKKYGMSQIENLEFIRAKGMEEFLKSERGKYQSDKGIFCVHDQEYHS
jgi:hypothetical protein